VRSIGGAHGFVLVRIEVIGTMRIGRIDADFPGLALAARGV